MTAAVHRRSDAHQKLGPRLPQAIEFAELEEFEDAPVRSYSDGMKLRLAFGVMTLLTPELLIVDEILAVGDLAFQEKCLNHLTQLRSHGTAIVIASHDMEQIVEMQPRAAAVARRGACLRRGGDGGDRLPRTDAERTLEVTPEADDEADDAELELQTEPLRLAGDVRSSASRSGAEARPRRGAFRGQPRGRACACDRNPKRTVAVTVAVEREDDDVKCLDINTDLDEVQRRGVRWDGGRRRSSYRLPTLELRPGRYWVDVGVFPLDWSHAFDYHYPRLSAADDR